MKVIPTSKPKITKEEIDKVIKSHYEVVPPVVLVGIRGYYSKSMGETDGNDINIYDDAILIVTNSSVIPFNGNTDPSFVKTKGRALAKLDTGKYKFYKGKHKNKYNALRSYPEGVVLPCTRDGKPSTCSYINIHKGGSSSAGFNLTWSEGCQTIPSTQWDSFIVRVYDLMNSHSLKTIDYLLIDNKDLVV